MSVDQIQQREKINPDNIHKVPVQAAHFDGRVVLRRVTSLPGVIGQENENPNSDDHVQGVQPGHGEIQREINLLVARVDVNVGVVFSQLIYVKRWTRDVVLCVFVVPLDPFDPQKGKPEHDGQ